MVNWVKQLFAKLGSNWVSGAPSTGPTLSGEHGRTLIKVVDTAWYSPFSVSGNLAREHAQIVAMAASCGYITTERTKGDFGRVWLVTERGLDFLAEHGA